MADNKKELFKDYYVALRNEIQAQADLLKAEVNIKEYFDIADIKDEENN